MDEKRLIEFVTNKNDIQEKHPNTEIEIEIRIDNMNKEKYINYKKMIIEKNANTTGVVSYYIDIRANNDTIRRQEYKKENDLYTKQKLEYIQKEQLCKPGKINDFKFTASAEKSIKNIATNTYKLARIKKRISYNIENNTWRADLTEICQIDSAHIPKLLSKCVDLIFKNIKSNDSSNLHIKYEVEFEYIGDIDKFNINTSNVIINNYRIINSYKDDTIELKYYITKMIGLPSVFESIKKSLPNVITLTQNVYKEKLFPPMTYFITNKTDGYHALLVVKGNTIYLILDNKILTNTIANNENGNLNCIVEGEYMPLVDETNITGDFYGFDILIISSNILINENFKIRISHLSSITATLCTLGINAKEKQFEEIINMDILEEFIANYDEDKYDGLIFINSNQTYLRTLTYKWKSLRHNTIDFLVRKSNETDIYYLFVGISMTMLSILHIPKCNDYDLLFPVIQNKNYVPIQFYPPNNPFVYKVKSDVFSGYEADGNIMEMRWSNDKWIAVRLRTDRTGFGNNYKTAESVWQNYLNPFKIEQLTTGINVYFQTKKSRIDYSYIYFMSMVKESYLVTLSGNILDIGIGQGQDIKRYFKSNISNLIGLDNDNEALCELLRRRLNYVETHKHTVGFGLYLLPIDMSSPYTEIRDLIYNFNIGDVNTVIINLSIHYIISSMENIRNIVNLCDSVCKRGGEVIIMCMFGNKVVELLQNIETGHTWNQYKDKILKFSIKKLYKSDILTIAGQQIGVKLPFSDDEYYTEYLVNTDVFIDEFKLHNFENTFTHTLSHYFDSIAAASELDEHEKKYVDLYGIMKFKKIKD